MQQPADKNKSADTGKSGNFSFDGNGGKSKSNAIDIPSISLPKGGGAIKGIDEKFSVNAVNGTAAFSVPLPFTTARGATPSLSLAYNSGAGNGIFGLGWSLDLPSVKRKTSKQLPLYNDENDSDTFLFSGAEDLVPEFAKAADGSFLKDSNDQYIISEKNSADDSFRIRYYKPRVEGLFAKIERWRHKKSGEIKWRVITKDNTTTLFGWSAASRIADPDDLLRIFEWLPEFVFDDKGNCVHYIYKQENTNGFVQTNLHNNNRKKNGQITYTNTYLLKVLYGNKTPYKQFGDAFPADNDFLFETSFDYGAATDGDAPDNLNEWDFRVDAFSEYKPGFEVRTTRLCKRVLLFHHFTGANEYDGLVRSLNFEYNTNTEQDFTFLTAIIPKGYIKKNDGSYSSKQLPPFEFRYQPHEWNDEVRSLPPEALVHAPTGFEELPYQFVDLFNEGLSGIMTEQATGWYYKHNLGNGNFTHAKLVSPKPSFTGLGSKLQLADLEADGNKQLVIYNTQPQGYFELDDDNNWHTYRPFKALPTIRLDDPFTRMIDLNGDGRAELLISEENVFVWYESSGKNGFKEARKSFKSYDEEAGPALIFKDQNQSIFLADMCGDGLTDIVRIRHSEVCYWPNLGYGKFGAKVAMDNAPFLDGAADFNPSLVKLADIDGSGTTDIIYLGKNKCSCWKNLSGNRFSTIPFEIVSLPAVNAFTNVTISDLLGNGIACIVWSSRLPQHVERHVQYIDLMNSRKPHIMIGYRNNLGKEVSFEYIASTHFYLKDKAAGNPWITKLHFPVHCVAKTIVQDRITGHQFTTSYQYHHGYYDHAEQEFRGFGMVEQTDAETFEHWVRSGATNITEQDLHQEPVITKQWFHTGAYLRNDKILTQFAQEYWHEEMKRRGYAIEHHEKTLTDAVLIPAKGIPESVITAISAEEYQQVLRACKGIPLRSEVFAKDAVKFNNTQDAIRKELIPYVVSTRNCIIELLQPKGNNPYAVFVVKESEAIHYHYERVAEDPRIAHTCNIRIDEYGNVLESATIVYPRRSPDTSLLLKLQEEQNKTLITYTHNQFTNDLINDNNHRLRLSAAASTYELKGVKKAGDYYKRSDFENILDDANTSVALYHERNKPLIAGKAQRRLIEQVKSLYYKKDLTGPLPLFKIESKAILYEHYQLAYTPELITNIYDNAVNPLLIVTDAILNAEGKFEHSKDELGNNDANWWIRSGTIQYIAGAETDTDAQNRFYTPVAYADPFGATTKVKYYNNHFLVIAETEDALGNRTKVTDFNFRTLLPKRLLDVNDNISEILTDELGLVKAMAVSGKGNQADSLVGLKEETDATEQALIQNFFNAPVTAQGVTDSAALIATARQLLQNATARFAYDVEAYQKSGKPAVAASVLRETHTRKENGDLNTASNLQLSFEYASGSGQVTMKKNQAAPGDAKRVKVQPGQSISVDSINTTPLLRWIGNGKAILNNKGNIVKQYEPYFSVSHQYEDFEELVEAGVTPLMYYDAADRLVRTEMPDGSLSKIIFDRWQQFAYDANDAVSESDWYKRRTDNTHPQFITDAKEQQAAAKALLHASTPHQIHFDTLGRPILSVEHNKNISTQANELYNTMLDLDIEGNLLSVTDARGNKVMEYKYDMLGNKVYQKSMDAGQRWLLTNCMGKPLRTWDERNHEFQYFYDIAHRPLYSKVLNGDGPALLDHIFDRIVYGESLLAAGRTNEATLKADNILGQPVQHYDTGGLVATSRYDFKGQPISTARKLFRKYKETADWKDVNLLADLENETFTWLTKTDALGRVIEQTVPDGSIITFLYSESGLLNGETVLHPGAAASTTYIKNIAYNEKGQREKIIYGNDITIQLNYDRETFRLKELNSRRFNGDLLQDWNYTYDPVGNITHIEDKVAAVHFFRNAAVPSGCSYTYDALYRLAEATGRENDAALNFDLCDNWNDKAFTHNHNINDPMAMRNYTQHYLYDATGNITEMKHTAGGGNWTRGYEYENNTNRLKKTFVGGNGGPRDYTNYTHHVRHGYMEELPHLEKIGWNFKEEVVLTTRQRCTEDNIPVITYYQYDGNGQRIRKITENQAAGGATPVKKDERIYITGYELYKKHNGPDAGLERVCISLSDQEHRFVLIETRNNIDDGTEQQLVRYQLHNQLGSSALELNESAAVISYEEYHPYGTTAYQARNAAIRSTFKRYRYTGMERDEETGLEYHAARYYLPWLGRWLSSDPIGIGDGVNMYGYVKNNPVILEDPSGLSSEYDEKPQQILDLEKSIGSYFEQEQQNGVEKFFNDIVNGISEIAKDIEQGLSDLWEGTKKAASDVWEWFTGDDGFLEDALEFIGHLTWGLPGTLVGGFISFINLTIGNLVVGIHNLFTDDAHDWQYAGISIGGPNNEDDIIGNYGGFWNLFGQSAITFGPFVFFGGSPEDVNNLTAGKTSDVKEYYAKYENLHPGYPYGAAPGLRTADHEEGHEDQNLIYGPFTLLMGLIFSLVPNGIGANVKTSPWFWYDRQANKLSGKNSVVNPNPHVHP